MLVHGLDLPESESHTEDSGTNDGRGWRLGLAHARSQLNSPGFFSDKPMGNSLHPSPLSWLMYDLFKKYLLPTHSKFKDATTNMLQKCLLILIFIWMTLGLGSYNFSL